MRRGLRFLALAAGASLIAGSMLSACTPDEQFYTPIFNFKENSVTPLAPVTGDRVSVTIERGNCPIVLLDQPDMAATSDSGTCPTQITFTPAERERLEGLIGKYQPIDPHTFSLEFVYDSDALTPDGQQAFKSMTADMASRKASTVKVIGYTDSVGSDPYNLELSKQRADAVVKLLVDQGLVKRQFITAEGRGKLLKDDIDRGEGCRDSRVTPDQTPEPHNRCVEISVR